MAKLAALLILLASLAVPALAVATTVAYTGEAVNSTSGQSHGLPIYVGFQLSGAGCPTGPKCLAHASVQKLVAVDWAYPNCSEILEEAFELKGSHPVGGGSHLFSASDSPPEEPQRHVTFSGRLQSSGKASGFFEVKEAGCSTGRVHWTAKPD